MPRSLRLTLQPQGSSDKALAFIKVAPHVFLLLVFLGKNIKDAKSKRI